MKHFYLVMAVAGTAIPWLFFSSFIVSHGIDIPLFIQSLFANPATGGFTADILISITVFWVWSYDDAKGRGIKTWWLVLPAVFCVGLSLAMPLYLYLRETQSSQKTAQAAQDL
ncbi:DUF2834 domain-containing protein [Roseibium algae]|uniref:DUF2834 domain-containing protein n=1 Tax=Roseibium algae TaxID=3123038 RepID=A0ABU8TRQ2_9HYPH